MFTRRRVTPSSCARWNARSRPYQELVRNTESSWRATSMPRPACALVVGTTRAAGARALMKKALSRIGDQEPPPPREGCGDRHRDAPFGFYLPPPMAERFGLI